MGSATTQTGQAEKSEQPLPAVPDASKENHSTKKVLTKFKTWKSNKTNINTTNKPPLTNASVNDVPKGRRKSISSGRPVDVLHDSDIERKITYDETRQIEMTSGQHSPPPAQITRRPVDLGANGGAAYGRREEDQPRRDVTTVNADDYNRVCNEQRESEMRMHLERIARDHAGCAERLAKRDTDCTELEADNQRLSKKLTDVNKRYEEEIAQSTRRKQSSDRLKSRISELKSQVEKLQGQLQVTESDKTFNYNIYAQEMVKSEELKEQIKELKNNHGIALKSFTNLETENIKDRAAYQELNQAYNENLHKLGKLQDSVGTVLDDESLAQKWLGLRDKIESWAITYYLGPGKNMFGVLRHLEAQSRPGVELLKLSDDCQDLMLKSEDGRGRALIAEAYLWTYLEETVFDARPDGFSKGFLWAHNARPDLIRLEKFFRPGEGSKEEDLRKFYKWKASTSRLLISRITPPLDRRRVQVDPDTIEYMCTRVLEILQDWFVKTEHKRKCREELQKIMQLAIDLDTYIHEQWCQIYPTSKANGFGQRHGFQFDSYWMEQQSDKDRQLASNQLVGLVISPALVRRGTATGDEYNRTTVLVKSRVLPQAFASSTLKWIGI